MIYIKNDFFTWLELSLVGSLYTEFRVGTDISTAIVVDWGDETTSSYSGTLMTISHTYSSAFTGSMKISCSDGNDFINRLDTFSASNTLNSIAFTTIQIGTFPSLNVFKCIESNIISGNLSSLPQTLTQLQVYGSNTIIGDLNSLPSILTQFYLHGNNVTTGDISTLPSTLQYYDNKGANITYGNISTLPTNLLVYSNEGFNTTSGSIASLPNSLTTYINEGYNITDGSIASLPSGLTIYQNKGSNITTGDISSLSVSLTHYNNGGSNITMGNISSLHIGLILYVNGGNNTTNGNISTLPNTLIVYSNSGSNTTTGSLNSLPASVAYYTNSGLNTVVDYTAGKTWYDPMRAFLSLPTSASGGLSSTEVDNLLIDLAIPNWVQLSLADTKIVNIAGYNAARTSASNAAVATLISKGVTVTTN